MTSGNMTKAEREQLDRIEEKLDRLISALAIGTGIQGELALAEAQGIDKIAYLKERARRQEREEKLGRSAH